MSQGIYRVKKSRDFSVINNAGLRDGRLSFGARGVWAYLMTKPDDWQVRAEDLTECSPHGREAVLNMLKELERFGYLRRWRERGEKGRYEWHTEIYENPSDNPDFSDILPKSAFPTQVEPTQDKPAQVNPTSLEELNKEILTHTPRETSAETQTFAHPAKPDFFALSEAQAVKTPLGNQAAPPAPVPPPARPPLIDLNDINDPAFNTPHYHAVVRACRYNPKTMSHQLRGQCAWAAATLATCYTVEQIAQMGANARFDDPTPRQLADNAERWLTAKKDTTRRSADVVSNAAAFGQRLQEATR